MSGNKSGSGTVKTGGQQAPTQPTLAQRIEEIGKLKGKRALGAKATLARTGDKVKKSTEEKVERLKNALTGTKSELDYVRRHTRLTESFDDYAEDPLMRDPLQTAKTALTKLPPVPVDGKTIEWAGPYVALGQVADALLKASQLCAAQRKGASEHPTGKDVMRIIEQAQQQLDTRALKQAQYKSFNGTLRLLSADVVACVTSKNDLKLAAAKRQAEGAATAIDLALKAAAALLERAMARHTELTRHMSASTIDDQKRLEVAGLLNAGEAAARAYDEPGANEKFDAARDLLGTDVPKNMPTAQSVRDEIAAKGSVKFKVNTLIQSLGNVAEDSRIKALYNDAMRLQTSIDSLDYMLEKGGDAVAGDAKRMLDGLNKQFAGLETAKSFDAKTAGGVAMVAFTKACKPVETEATQFYASAGAEKGYVGAFHGRVEALKQRLADNAKTANCQDDLHYDQLAQQLEALRAEIKQSAGGTKPSPDKLAYQSAANRFRQLIRQLDDKATETMSRDSDLAMKLGLVTRPAQLRRKGEQLAVTEPPPDQLGTAANGLKGVNVEIQTELDKIANQPPEKPPTADALRQQCQTLKQGYETRLTNTLTLVDTDLNKFGLTRDLKADQLKGLKDYGAALKKRLEMLAAPAADGATSDKGVLTDAKTALTKFAAEVTKFEQMGPGKSHVGGKKHFEDVTSLADEILKSLDHTLFGPRAEIITDWKTTAEGVKKAPAKRDPDVVHQELTTIKGQIALAKTAAKTEHDEAEKEIGAIQKLWDLITVPNSDDLVRRIRQYPKAFAQFARECDQAIEAIRAADKPDTGTLNRLKNKYDELTTGAGDKMTGAETTAGAADKEYEQALAGLKQLLEVDLKLMGEKAGQLGGVPGKEMLKQVASGVKAAELAVTSLKKTHDAKQAQTMIDSITMRLRSIEDSPQGSKTNGRNQIKQVEIIWKQAVGAIHSRLDDMPAAVKKACAGESPAVIQAADALTAKLIAPIKSLFNPDAFKAVVARLENGGETAMLDAREDGLAEVRRLRRVMLADPKVRMTGPGCPFKDAKISFRPIESALMNLETNFNINDTV